MIAQINALLSRVFDLHRAEQERVRQEEKEGKCFNVFSTLCLCSDETRLHSRLLAALLNPKANHGLGNAFLESFLRAIGLPPDYISGCKEPIVERSIGRIADVAGGRIDIILEDGKQRHAIIIENKIYANDQTNQLLRYRNYGKEQFGERNFKLVYLTLYGCEPHERSWGGEKFEVIKLSYAQDILKLLENLALTIPPIPVHSTIKDYIKIIRQLTYQDMETEYTDSIIKAAIDSIEGASALLSLSEGIEKKLIQDYIKNPLMDVGFKERQDDNGALWKDLERHHAIVIKSDDRTYWKEVFIGISRKDGAMPCQPKLKLECFTGEPTQTYPYGWSWISDKEGNNWHNPSEYPAIKRGEVLDWIKRKIEEIETCFGLSSYSNDDLQE